jgi:hypothetical protein
MKKVIVFSLWGDNSIYWTGAVRNIELAKKFYPDWFCRFYVDSNCKKELIETLSGENVEIVLMNSSNYDYSNISPRFNHSGLFWRFLALSDESVDYVISRDCDSRISKRESDAVNEWLNSDKRFHIMRDHPYHRVPILAGMWGCKREFLSNIKELLNFWENYPHKGVFHAEDQDFLGQLIYSLVKNECMEHSEFNISYGNEIRNFPEKRVDYEFIGDVFDENDNRNPDYWILIKNIEG